MTIVTPYEFSCPDCYSQRWKHNGSMQGVYAQFVCEECGCMFNLYGAEGQTLGHEEGSVEILKPGRRRDVIAGREMDKILGRVIPGHLEAS